MLRYTKALASLAIGLAALIGYAERSMAQQNPITAIDIALEPDATMIRHARADNARLLKAFPKGFALDATHHPHVSLLQQFVRTADLEKVYAAASKVLAGERPSSWKLTAFKYYYIPAPPLGLAGIVVEPTADLLRLQREIIDAVLPFTVKTGTAAAFMSTEDGRDIQQSLIDYVATFVPLASGEKFNPHVTIGVGTETYLKEMLAEPFERSSSRQRERRFTSRQFWDGSKGAEGFGAEAVKRWLGKRASPEAVSKVCNGS